ncbi:phage/plasmid replication, II/X family protein [Burkholderia pseudomallei MSHR4303]|nr:phage/plasmid replication, II/X family protein [Burkholderia pseudomallei MSHR4303]ONC71211.1 hypothetical protein AQ920_01820 [Burkholderia pseudomallei]
MLDTFGFNVEDVNAELPTTFDVNGKRSKSIAQLYAPSGRRSAKAEHTAKHNRLSVEGSAAIHFQNHNIVASNDLRMTVLSLLKAFNDKYALNIPLSQAYDLFRGQGIAMTRVDTPAMLRLPTGLTPGAVANGLALAGLQCEANVSLYRNGTFYFDQHSQLVSLKGYAKGPQMDRQAKKARLPDTENAAALRELADSTLRVEVVYRKKHFKRLAQFSGGLPAIGDLSPRILAEMFARQLESYNLRGRMRVIVTDEQLQMAGIPRQHRAVVMLWQHGHDLRKFFDGDKRALDRMRYLLRKNHSIDIDQMPPGEIEVPVQVGEILHPDNFLPVPEAIRRDPELFHVFDVHKEWRSICDRRGLPNGITRAFVDLYAPLSIPRRRLSLKCQTSSPTDCSAVAAKSRRPVPIRSRVRIVRQRRVHQPGWRGPPGELTATAATRATGHVRPDIGARSVAL